MKYGEVKLGALQFYLLVSAKFYLFEGGEDVAGGLQR